MERIELEDFYKDPEKILRVINKIIQEIECLKGGKESTYDKINRHVDEVIIRKMNEAFLDPKEPTTGGWEERFDEVFLKTMYQDDGYSEERAVLKAFIAREKEASYKEGVKETMLGVAKLIDGFDKLTNK
jgi:hypothetical protein